MISLKTRLRAAQDNLHAARSTHERGDTNRSGGSLANDDRSLKPNVLKDRRLVGLLPAMDL